MLAPVQVPGDSASGRYCQWHRQADVLAITGIDDDYCTRTGTGHEYSTNSTVVSLEYLYGDCMSTQY